MLGPKELSDIICEQVAKDEKLSESQIILCRHDGVVLYTTQDDHQSIDLSSIGVLISGSWQAARSLVEFVPSQAGDDFRFSFDTSDSGVFILDIFVGNRTYFLAAIFSDVLNPGIIKSKMRSLVFLLNHLEENHKIVSEDKSNKSDTSENHQDDKILFENITDDEIDKMFSFAGI